MKQTKRQTLPSRRRRTLRRLLIAAAALCLVNRIFLIGLLFPIQAIRQNEERTGTGRTTVICRDWATELQWSRLTYLMGNEHVTFLTGTYLSYLGWLGDSGAVLDCSEEAALHCGLWSINQGDGKVLYVFGRIDDPAIVRLKIQGRQTVFSEEQTDQVAEETYQEWTLEQEKWMEKDGRRYFLMKTVSYEKSSWSGQDFSVTGYNKYDEMVAEEKIEEGAFTSFV